jgi:lysyl-tRNA synthetase class 2
MATIDELILARKTKLARLLEKGINPYPSTTLRTHSIGEVLKAFESYVSDNTRIVCAGRVMAMRAQGAIAFVDIYDGTERMQIVLKEDVLKDAFTLFNEVVDIGDFIEASGICFVTARGQQSLDVASWTMLSKSLLPLPDKWHGIVDPDERFRKRYLDLLMDADLQKLFYQKALFWNATRTFMIREGFLEVDTPTIEVTTGGAEANPFKTHHDDFDIDVYLRISIGELWQKRLMAAGFPKTFEIGRAYRNEGTSPDHLQEFTNMEFYWAYSDYQKGMELVKKMYREIVQATFGTTKFNVRGHEFDFQDEWKIIEYVDEVKRVTGVDVLLATEEDMKAKLDELGVTYTGTNRERLTDTLWKYCRKQIAGPAFLVHHPKLVSPLAKESATRPGTVERFNVIIAGTEVGNGFSELNDPTDQRARFTEQQKLLEGGDSEAMMPDYEFVEMLEYGMPPTCGFGFGERLFAILSDKPIRETTLFPLMRPKID